MIDFARYLNIRSATTPILSADGRRVAFLSDITGAFQVWSAPVEGGWPQQLTFFPDKVWEVHGAAGADHLLAVSDVGGNERQQFYLITNFGGSAGHDVRRLTPNQEAIHRFGGFSRDGQRVIYTSNARNGVDFDTYVLDIASGQETLLHQGAGNRSIMAWSPDERFVLAAESVGPLQDELHLLDLRSGGLAADAERRLTRHGYPARYEQVRWSEGGIYLLSDQTHDRGAICQLDTRSGELTEIVNADAHLDALSDPGEMELLALTGDGKQAAYVFNVDGYGHLYLLDLGDPQPRLIQGLPQGVISHLRFSRGGGSLLCDVQTPNHNPDIWQVQTESGQASRLTFSDKAGLAAATFVLPELIRFPTFDKRQIPAFYYTPQTPAPEGGYPCILYVHGGPTSQIRPDFDVRFQFFLNQGYAILAPNVRGSTGYGREYMALDEIELRMDSVQDLQYAVLWLHAQAEINQDRVAIYGRSYGGYMVLAALTEYPHLFAAGINVVGIANWVTFLERTSAWRRAHREREYGSLAHDRELLTQISPIHKIEQITMPLMVIAGDNDPRVPLFESEQVADRVRAAGGTVEFLHYADEGHKISKLANRVDSFTRMGEFLERYL